MRSNPFPDMLKKLMSRDGLNQRQLADTFGLSEAAVSLYLSGKRNPRLRLYLLVEEMLNHHGGEV